MTTTGPHLADDGATTDAGGGADDLHRVVAAQADLIEQLQRRLERLEGEQGTPVAGTSVPASTTASTPASPAVSPAATTSVSALDTPTSRRNLMTKGAAAAASAVIGTAAVGIATATPAAAASGTFDGSPAVQANGTGSTGQVFGVVATSSSPDGYAIYAENSATTGPAKAVQAWTASPGGFAIDGANKATTGEAVGVHGYNNSPQGVSILGFAAATGTTASATGVKGVSQSAVGFGVEGHNLAASGEPYGVFGSIVSTSDSGAGVLGRSKGATGASYGVFGISDSNAGIGVGGWAFAPSGATTGVEGWTKSPEGTGVRATGGTGVAATSSRTQLRFDGAPAAPPGAGLARLKGELVFDTNADLWLCVADGTPGTWRKVAGPATAGAFTLLPSPQRAYDTRAGEPPLTGPKTPLGVRVPRAIDLSSIVAAGATAAMLSIVAVNHTAGGFVAVYKDGTPYPGTSNLTFEANLSASVTTVTALSSTSKFALYANVVTDAIVDVVGYYR